jgi:hypothetical protein
VKINKFDCSDFDNVHIFNPDGTGIKVEIARGCNMHNPRVVAGLNRIRFSEPSNWSSATADNVNDYVRIGYGAWSNVTTDAKDAYVADADGKPYRSRAASNTNHDPTISPTWWVLVRPEYYKCQIAHTNKDPQTFNENASSSGDCYWIFEYRDEAAFDLNQEETKFARSRHSFLTTKANSSLFILGCRGRITTTLSMWF